MKYKNAELGIHTFLYFDCATPLRSTVQNYLLSRVVLSGPLPSKRTFVIFNRVHMQSQGNISTPSTRRYIFYLLLICVLNFFSLLLFYLLYIFCLTVNMHNSITKKTKWQKKQEQGKKDRLFECKYLPRFCVG